MKFLPFITTAIPFVIALSAAAQGPVGARPSSLGGATVGMEDDGNAMGNPAALPKPERGTLGATQYVVITEPLVIHNQVYLLMPLKHRDVLAVSMNRNGFAGFHEQSLYLSVKKRLGRHWFGGARWAYHGVGIRGYGSTGAYSTGAGIFYVLSEAVCLGSWFSSIYHGIRIGPQSSQASIGFSYRPSQQVLLCGELEKRLSAPATPKLGIEYDVGQGTMLRTGCAFRPLRTYYGAGWRTSRWVVGASAGAQQRLGRTMQISMSYDF